MKHKQGFTLIELSMVLAIVGLIIGGILVGVSMVRNSQIQSVISDLDRIKQAIGLFKTKYTYLPGDMSNAESFWGSDVSCPNTATNTVVKVATCNGNGDGMISNWNYATNIIAANETETFRAWQQLADAGLLPGTYTGVTGAAGAFNPVAGVNSPRPAFPGASYSLLWWYNPNGAASAATYAHKPDHIITVGASTSISGASAALFTAQEAVQIDTKADDGLPGYGNIIGPNSTSMPNCTTTDVPATAQYNIGSSGAACYLTFHLGF